MEVQFGPNSADEPNLLYKLQRKIKVFNTTDPLRNRGYDLVASSSKYGLVFVASPDGTLSAYHLRQLVDIECQNPPHFDINLQEKPTHITVSCDQEFLAVTGGQIICVFQIANFNNQNVKPSIFMKTDISPTAVVSALQWNPCIPDTIAIAFNDGTLLVAQVNTAQVKKVQAKARCICWSPKGKQLVVGNSDGTLCQYKPDLTMMKTIPAPNIFDGSPVEAVATYWISTYLFAVVYRNAADNSRPAVTIVNTPKGGQISCLNYEDICYSMGSARPWYYYLIGIPQWNMILAASSNSMEIATLGSADGANWLQWTQSDEARPELPLTDKKQENFPVGVCIDTSAIHQLPWGESSQLPYMPHLLVMSHTGYMTIFNVINIRSGAPQLCVPPQSFALPENSLTTEIPGAAAVEAPTGAPTSTAPPKQEAPPPSYGFQITSVPAPTQSVKPTAFTQPPSQGFQALSPFPNQSQQPKHGSSGPIVVPTPQQAQTPMPVQNANASPMQTNEVTAALKADQEKANMLKANEELMNMLVKEVNDFQMSLYEFRVKTRELQIQTQNELNGLDASFELQSLDTERLHKECSLEELRGAIVQLKLELVRACAVVAEARSHSDAKDHQWTQADPLSTKRLASVKKLAYYVQNQLQQAHQALDHKWNGLAERDALANKSGTFMIRPILDDVYQPLVRQQEIIARQQAVIRKLQKTLNECDAAPVFKSTSLLRSTPFKKDPLSKLSKNILNMSIEQNDRLNIANGLSNQKLEALRDMLSNHKTVKIKPVNMELSEHLAAMRLSYEKSVKERGVNLNLPPVTVKEEVKQEVKIEPVSRSFQQPEKPKQEIKEQKPVSTAIPAFSPISVKQNANGLASVARTLFTDEPKQDPKIQTPTPQTPTQSKPFSFTSNTDSTKNKTSIWGINSAKELPKSEGSSANDMPSEATRSVLKNLLMNKQSAEAANTFMGQKICSPSAFASPSGQSTGAFTSKPISEISNMMSKFQPTQPFAQLTTKTDEPKMKSLETGEPEENGQVVIIEKRDKGKAAPFTMKNVPDLVKPNVTLTKVEKKPDASKENLQEVQKKESLPSIASNVATPAAPIPQVTASAQIIIPKPKPTKPAVEAPKSEKTEAKPPVSLASSIFAAGAAAASVKTTAPDTPPAEAKPVTSSSASIFGTSVSSPTSVLSSSSQSFGTNATSIFASANTTQSSVFSSNTQSVFGASKTPTTSVISSTKTETPTPASIFASAETETPTPASVFASAEKEPTSPSSVFGSATKPKPVTPSSVFGSATKPEPVTPSSVFGSATKPEPVTPSSVFGSATKPEPVTPSSVFGSATKTDASPSSVFAAAKTAPPSPSSIFASAKTEPATSVFASANKTETTTQSVFGGLSPQSVFGTATTSVFATATTTSHSMFGTAATQSSIFGSPSSQSSVFGATTTQSVFGNQATTQSSIFGGSPSTQTASVFGSATPTTQASIFGSPSTTQASVFGTPTPSTQASVFGATTPTTQASVFGSSPASVFGAPATTSSSLFGDSNLFASASISTTSASQSGGSLFGGGTTSFGASPSNVFGGKSTFGQQNQNTASIFGGGASFAQKPAANPWAGGTTTGSAFGASVFGQQPAQATSAFGTGSFSASAAPGQAFTNPTPQQGGSVFGSPQQQTAPAFGGFGSKPAFGQPSGFGSPSGFGQPAFGGGFNKSPGGGFGAPAAFGSGAAFGGAPAFGSTSPGKVFGGAATGFAAPTQSNATFESLATQETLTFGNLAQQSSPAAAPAFNTSPSFTGWRG